MSKLLTDSELAGIFGIELDELHRLRLRRGWPHVKLGRQVVRFTEEHVAEILRRESVEPAPEADPGDSTDATALNGQTARSAARSR